MRNLYVDGDVLVYEGAHAAQKTTYMYDGQVFSSSVDCQVFCEKNELDYRALRKDGSITSSTEVLPEGACLNIVRQKIDSIMTACGSTRLQLILSGDSNFRDDIAITKKYKGNRDKVEKPVHYQFVRNLLIERYRADVVSGIEADDALAMSLVSDPDGVLCSIDKDLMQIPGRHYNWGKGIRFRVKREDGLYWFHRQLLTGDSTDNIPGIPGLGEKKAEALLAGTRDNPLHGWYAVQAEYERGPFKFKDGKTTTPDKDAYLTEQMQLLWMCRVPDERITPESYEDLYL